MVDVDSMCKLFWCHLHVITFFRALIGPRKYLNFFPDFQNLEKSLKRDNVLESP